MAWRDQLPDGDSDAAFFRVTAPHWAARGLAYLLIVLFVASLVASIVIQIPETVSSRFVLAPVNGVDPIRASHHGTVAVVQAAEGESVLKEDTLFVIRSPAIGDLSAELAGLETQLAGHEERLANELRTHESQRLADVEEGRRLRERIAQLSRRMEQQREIRLTRLAVYRASLAIYRNDVEIAAKDVEFKTQHAAVATEIMERFEKYYGQGLVSWLDYNNRKVEASKLSADVHQLGRQLDSARLKLDQLDADREKQETDWQMVMAQLESEQREVSAALEKLLHESQARRTASREHQRSLSEAREKAAIRRAALKAELV